MRRLPLYVEPPQAAIMHAAPLPRDPACQRCSLAIDAKPRTPCMSAEGTPGGVLIVGDWPSQVDDQIGRPFTSGAGKYVRSLVAKYWPGPVALDHGVRCKAGASVKDESIEACRPYGRTVLQQVRPKRILCLGPAAVTSVLGHRPPLLFSRRGYGFLFDELDDPVPVFLLIAPVHALRNTFAKAEFERDFKWALTCDLPTPNFDASTSLVENDHDARQAVREAANWDSLTYDVETSGRMGDAHFTIESLTIMPTHTDGDGYTWTREALRDPAAFKPLLPVLASADIGKVTQNGKYDDRSVYTASGVSVDGVELDTRLARKLLEPEAAASLDILAYLVGLGGHKGEAQAKTAAICKELRRLANPPEGLTPTGKKRNIKPPAFPVRQDHLDKIAIGVDAEAFMFHYLDPETLYRYNARDVHVTRNDARLLGGNLQRDPQLLRVWEQLTKPASIAIRHMEQWGIACDADAVRNLATYCQGKIAEARQKIDLHKPGLNPNSPKQVGEYLFDELGLKPIKQTDSGANSTDAETLEALAHKHPVVAALVQTRKYVKLNGQYAEGMLAHIREDGRIHPSFLIDGTRTGRFSCADPNLQNLPRAEESEGNLDAAMSRNCFIAEPGFVLVELDFSQIELRVAAILSGDKVMIEDFKAGVDIHMNNATLSCEAAFGIPRAKWDAMNKDQRKPFRSQIKTATFAKLYGKTNGALAREWGVKLPVVEAISRAIWGRYKRLDAWTKETIALARKRGFVETWWDDAPAYRRPIFDIASDDEGMRKHAENEAVNTPVQGTASHFMSASLPQIVSYAHKENRKGDNVRVVLTVHDSVMLEVREKLALAAARKCRDIMCSHNSAGVPIDVEAKVGTAYGSMQELKL